jgi:hypothetical protein
VMMIGGALAPKHGATLIIRRRCDAATPRHRARATSSRESQGCSVTRPPAAAKTS